MPGSATEIWNQGAFLALNADAQSPALMIGAARFLADWAVYLVASALIVAWVRCGKAVRLALLDAGIAALIGLGIAQAVAAIWYHPRPFEIGLGHQFLSHAAEASFPSDHATLLFSLALVLLARPATRWFGGGVMVVGGLVAWARIYLGVHFPLDMIGAFGVAVLATVSVALAARPLHRAIYPWLLSVYDIALRRLGLPKAIFPSDR